MAIAIGILQVLLLVLISAQLVLIKDTLSSLYELNRSAATDRRRQQDHMQSEVVGEIRDMRNSLASKLEEVVDTVDRGRI